MQKKQGGRLSAKTTSKQTINIFWGLTLREAIMASFFGTMVALSKLIVRIPLKIPGHTGIIWMALLTMCVLTYKKGRAGTLAGLIAGMLAVILFLGKDGFLTFFKYFIPAGSLDLILSLFSVLRQKWYTTALVSLVCFSLKISIDILSGILLRIPLGPLLFGLKLSFFNHMIFGFTGGAIGYFIYNRFIVKR